MATAAVATATTAGEAAMAMSPSAPSKPSRVVRSVRANRMAFRPSIAGRCAAASDARTVGIVLLTSTHVWVLDEEVACMIDCI